MAKRPLFIASCAFSLLIGACTNYELIDDSHALVTEDHRLQGAQVAKLSDKEKVTQNAFFSFKKGDGFAPERVFVGEKGYEGVDTLYFALDSILVLVPEENGPASGPQKTTLWDLTDENGYYEMKLLLTRKSILSLYTNTVLHIRMEVDERSFYGSAKEGSSVKEIRVKMRNEHFQKEPWDLNNGSRTKKD